MLYELLISEDKRSYFINCKQKGEALEVGAVYIAPFSSSPMELLGENDAKLSVILPPEVTNQVTEMVAVNTCFYTD